jgi:phage-related protein
MEEKFSVEFLPEAVSFIDSLAANARAKVLYNIRKAQFINDQVLFKKLTDNIWEFRTIYNRTHYRVFAFWDKRPGTTALVIATHGLVKKTDKTPISDLERAERIRQTYLKQKD